MFGTVPVRSRAGCPASRYFLFLLLSFPVSATAPLCWLVRRGSLPQAPSVTVHNDVPADGTRGRPFAAEESTPHNWAGQQPVPAQRTAALVRAAGPGGPDSEVLDARIAK